MMADKMEDDDGCHDALAMNMLIRVLRGRVMSVS